MIIAQKAITAENQYSDKFFLAGAGSSFPGRAASICANVAAHGSTVTIRRYSENSASAPVVGIVKKTAVAIDEFAVPAEGWYDIGVATGDYGGTPVTLTVEQ